ncbi:MAG: chromate efflux transporter [Planctomycetaceae bacterium]
MPPSHSDEHAETSQRPSPKAALNAGSIPGHSPGAEPAGQPTWGEAWGAWLRIAALSFGGPAGQISVMHRILVDEKHWFSERQFQQALSFCLLLPGPEAHQLVTYTGWLLRGWRGGLCAGCVFILPGALALLGLSWLYVNEQTAPSLMSALYGIRAATVALVAGAVVRLSRRTLHTRLSVTWALLALLLLASGQVPFPAILALAAAGGALAAWRAGPSGDPSPAATGSTEAARQSAGAAHPEAITPPSLVDLTVVAKPPSTGPSRSRPRLTTTFQTALLWLVIWWLPVVLCAWWLGHTSVVVAEGLFFSKVAVCTLGGAYAILPYVARQAVERHGWLTAGEMVDGLGMAESTPGPLVIVLQFVGFLAAWKNPGGLPPIIAALAGALISTWVTFAPSFLFVFTAGPWFQRLAQERWLAGALAGTSAATVGVLLHLLIWLAIAVWLVPATSGSEAMGLGRSLDGLAFGISLAAGIALLRYRIGLGWVLGAAAAVGLLLRS